MDLYLRATEFFDYDTPAVQAWLARQLEGLPEDPVTRIRALYLAVRDGIRYNPYVFHTDPATFKASHALAQGETYCIPKAVLLGAAARAIGIPSRLGLADVRNHLSSPKLIEWLRSDIFRMHGYIELYLNGRWVKATPAFNADLCHKMKVAPLAFDGVHDSLFQEYTEDGQAHMEYIADHGTFDDLPYAFIVSGVRAAYGHLFPPEGESRQPASASLEQDLAQR
ncbi:transglutaminase family protein [Marinobacter lutaoensis]|mgnify:CR=1 FL=1|uniref:Cysteine protease n=1 Tax=Marinobacter lutaoensis TaxID=135739 RepID=A0A1V2DNH2_9GAMM|nr:transglutaminase family protein [Marinobacter lutaoensis]MBE01736.1 cysteine protease [Marinobacter sp.]MBI43740.1 cysteine protease [Oceanospirillales bacterium]ONF42192.1 cysteine protease [Marinobacter lutaoensis]|tara:strand:- start:49 stop:720 length:672 start_codon:yes stop_codon:yes gene_type:complete